VLSCLAWACTWAGLPGVTAYYKARSRGRARYLSALTIAECFGDTVGEALVRTRVLRAPLFDQCSTAEGGKEGHISNTELNVSDTKENENG